MNRPLRLIKDFPLIPPLAKFYSRMMLALGLPNKPMPKATTSHLLAWIPDLHKKLGTYGGMRKKF